MAIITCYECMKPVSNIAEACPFCGFPVAWETRKREEARRKAEYDASPEGIKKRKREEEEELKESRRKKGECEYCGFNHLTGWKFYHSKSFLDRGGSIHRYSKSCTCPKCGKNNSYEIGESEYWLSPEGREEYQKAKEEEKKAADYQSDHAYDSYWFRA